MQDQTLTNQELNSQKSELWNLSIKDLFYKYVRYIPLFLLSVALALLIAFAYLRYSTRIYSASGTMLIISQQQTGPSDKVEDIITGSNRSQGIQNEIEMLKSRPLMSRVVNKLNLQFSYTAKGKVKDFNIYKQGAFQIEAFEITDSSKSFTLKIRFVNENQFRFHNEEGVFAFGQIFRNQYGVFRVNKQLPPPAGSEYSVTWQPTDAVAAALVGGLKVQPKIPGTGILTITTQTTNAHMAADIVNNLMKEYDSMTVEQNNFSTDQMLNFINERLDILSRELDSVQQILLVYQQQNNLIDIDVQLGMNFEKISETDKLITEEQLRMLNAEMVENYLVDKRNRYSEVVVPTSLSLEDNTLNELVSSYNRAQLERQSLLDAGVTAQNPTVLQVEGRVEKLRESVIENIRNLKTAFNANINTLRRKNLSGQSQVKDYPYKIKKFIELKRQVDTKLALYNLLEGKREEAAIGRASTISNSKVIEQAGVSSNPVKPNKRTIQLLAILIGIGIPALVIFMSEVLNDKISTRFDIEKITQAPILGEIGHSYSDNTLIVNKTSRTMVAEQFRIIRSNLQYILHKDKSVILVTSSFSGEGKSFVSTNMAAVLALTGKRTVILEFDIRKPKVLSGLNMPRRPGITNFLLGKSQLEELITQVPNQDNLFVLACGPVPPNPSEMLLDKKVTELFDWLRQNFEVIVVDTAPIGMVSDAMTLSKFADCTLYLVRQGHTFKKQIVLVDELYRENKLPKVSIIINDVKVKPGYGYYGYGRYGYGYGYGYGSSYYEEEKAPKTKFERIMSRFDIRKLWRKHNRN